MAVDYVGRITVGAHGSCALNVNRSAVGHQDARAVASILFNPLSCMLIYS